VYSGSFFYSSPVSYSEKTYESPATVTFLSIHPKNIILLGCLLLGLFSLVFLYSSHKLLETNLEQRVKFRSLI